MAGSPANARISSEKEVGGYPLVSEPVLAHDSEEWLTTARQKRLALLNLGDSPAPVPA